MNDFKSKFNYIVFGLRAVFFIFFVGSFFLFIIKGAPSFFVENKFGFKVILGLCAGLFLFVFLPYRFGKLLISERDDISFVKGELTLKDAITSKVVYIDKGNIKGFSTTIYQTKVWDFKSIIVYFQNGDKVEFPQFLYWNFKEIQFALIDNGIQYLGYEPYRWKWFDTRHYLYD